MLSIESAFAPCGCAHGNARTPYVHVACSDGKEWCSTFAQFNSGTYNNEFLVVNMNLFQPGAATLLPGTLFLLDQVKY